MKTKTDFLLNNIRECLFNINTVSKCSLVREDVTVLVARALDYLIDLDIELIELKKG